MKSLRVRLPGGYARQICGIIREGDMYLLLREGFVPAPTEVIGENVLDHAVVARRMAMTTVLYGFTKDGDVAVTEHDELLPVPAGLSVELFRCVKRPISGD